MGAHNSRRMIDEVFLSSSDDDSDHELDYTAVLQTLINRYNCFFYN